MKTTSFTIKQKGVNFGFIIFLLLLFCSILYIETTDKKIHLDLFPSIVGISLLFFLFFFFLPFKVKINDTSININGVTNIPFQDIKKAYIGDFSFIESFEDKDKLPLLPFKDEQIKWYFSSTRHSNTLLAIQTPQKLFFIKKSYFNNNSFTKLVSVLKNKDIFIEVQKKK